MHFFILHPVSTDYQINSRKTNNMSCVLRIASAEGSVLLTADIEADDERILIARSPSLLPSDVLLAPHHGSSNASTPEFIAAVGARDVIFPRATVILSNTRARKCSNATRPTVNGEPTATGRFESFSANQQRFRHGGRSDNGIGNCSDARLGI